MNEKPAPASAINAVLEELSSLLEQEYSWWEDESALNQVYADIRPLVRAVIYLLKRSDEGKTSEINKLRREK